MSLAKWNFWGEVREAFQRMWGRWQMAGWSHIITSNFDVPQPRRYPSRLGAIKIASILARL